MSQVRSNGNNKKDYSSNIAMKKIIYPIYMNRKDLSKMTKQQLIEMIPRWSVARAFPPATS